RRCQTGDDLLANLTLGLNRHEPGRIPHGHRKGKRIEQGEADDGRGGESAPADPPVELTGLDREIRRVAADLIERIAVLDDQDLVGPMEAAFQAELTGTGPAPAVPASSGVRPVDSVAAPLLNGKPAR